MRVRLISTVELYVIGGIGIGALLNSQAGTSSDLGEPFIQIRHPAMELGGSLVPARRDIDQLTASGTRSGPRWCVSKSDFHLSRALPLYVDAVLSISVQALAFFAASSIR